MGSSSSQSPRANRSSTQDPLEHAKGEVQDSARTSQRVAPENVGAEKIKSDLSIESINSRAYKPRGG